MCMCGQFLVSEEIVDSLRHLVPREHWEEIELDLHPQCDLSFRPNDRRLRQRPGAESFP